MDSSHRSLPPHRKDGTLPPTSEPDGAFRHPSTSSPYPLTVPELIPRFGTTRARLDLLEGFLGLRKAIRAHGFADGYHWIGGSFVHAKGTPSDIDVVSFVRGPAPFTESLLTLHPDLFGEKRVKELYRCDARFMDLRAPTCFRTMLYWMQIYSCCKPVAGDDPETRYDRRVGFLHVPIATPDEDAAARAVLAATRRKVDDAEP